MENECITCKEIVDNKGKYIDTYTTRYLGLVETNLELVLDGKIIVWYELY